MPSRLDYKKTSSDVFQAMLALAAVVDASGLEARLLDWVRLRAFPIKFMITGHVSKQPMLDFVPLGFCRMEQGKP